MFGKKSVILRAVILQRTEAVKSCKEDENKYKDIYEISNLEIQNCNFGSAGRRDFTFINISELG